MSPLPTHMRDRWSNRAEPAPGRGAVYWHILMHPYPQACAAATDAQKILEGFTGFHLTPPRWLHIPTLVAGSTDQIARDQMTAMSPAVARLLR